MSSLWMDYRADRNCPLSTAGLISSGTGCREVIGAFRHSDMPRADTETAAQATARLQQMALSLRVRAHVQCRSDTEQTLPRDGKQRTTANNALTKFIITPTAPLALCNWQRRRCPCMTLTVTDGSLSLDHYEFAMLHNECV